MASWSPVPECKSLFENDTEYPWTEPPDYIPIVTEEREPTPPPPSYVPEPCTPPSEGFHGYFCRCHECLDTIPALSERRCWTWDDLRYRDAIELRRDSIAKALARCRPASKKRVVKMPWSRSKMIPIVVKQATASLGVLRRVVRQTKIVDGKREEVKEWSTIHEWDEWDEIEEAEEWYTIEEEEEEENEEDV